MDPSEQNKTRASNVRAVWDALQAPRWDKNTLIALGKDLYAKRSLKDLGVDEFNQLLPRLVEIVEVLEARFKLATHGPERALWESLRTPGLDKDILSKLVGELDVDGLDQLTTRLVEILELLGTKFKPDTPAVTPRVPAGAPGVTGAVGPGPCPSGSPGAVGPAGCTTGPSGPAAPASQPATRKTKGAPATSPASPGPGGAAGPDKATGPANAASHDGATGPACLPPERRGSTPPQPARQPGTQEPTLASESATPGTETEKE